MAPSRISLPSLLCLAIFLVLTILSTWSSQEHTINERCGNLLTSGKWPQTLSWNNQTRVWAPHGCMLYPYKSKDVYECLSQRSLTFLGDSTARELFWAVSNKLDEERSFDLYRSSRKHQNHIFRVGQVDVDFVWDPFLNASALPRHQLFSVSNLHSRHDSDVLVVGAGLWHIKHLGTSLSREDEISDLLQDYLEPRSAHLSAIMLPISTSQSSRVTTNKAQLVEQKGINRSNKFSDEISSSENENTTLQSTIFSSYLGIVEGTDIAFKPDGIHISESITPVIVDVLLNSMCNDLGHLGGNQQTAYCCVPNSSLNAVQKLFFLATLVFVLYNTLKHLTKYRWTLFSPCRITYGNGKRPCVSQAVASILVILLYCFIADRTFMFEKVNKLVDPTSFIVLSGLLLLTGLASISNVTSLSSSVKGIPGSHCSPSQLLSRSQTEEWKGWMQIIVLLYHYFGMSKVLWAYQLARVLVASYLFMTGYGHTMYFLQTGDFSCRRVAIVLFRTNILSVMLAFVMGTQFDLYYFPMLSSLWFLIIYITIIPVSKSAPTVRKLILRVMLSMLTVKLMSWPLAPTISIMDFLFQIPSSLGIGLFKINGEEFMFRFRLDAYVVYIGMLAAIYCSRMSLVDDSTTAAPSKVTIKLFYHARRLSISVSCCLILAYLFFCAICKDKYDYNQWHPIISPFVVMAFVVLRNSTATISGVYCQWFAWFGRCSLETFVLQYHIWLAADSHGLLRLSGLDMLLGVVGPKTRLWIEIFQFVFLSALFLWASAVVSSALPVLTALVLNKPVVQTSESRYPIDLTTSGRFLSASKKSMIGVRAKVVIFALLLWVLNLCWLYLD
ncbi:hypothetical protein LTR84_004174 [Exophiala bonariae]|uniref:Cas1p 10 TM acyl transferase domain-containing protein n=1 Tax=Exophiala bonariae TaxID=1690606 RepID=A0AAV9N9M5_9EURO|nr:hypothetical protein LTR84_004174 [Exophiala bonariae]